MTSLLPPCEAAEDETGIDCWVCMDTGEARVEGSAVIIDCPDCRRGEWTSRAEAADEARRGR